MICYRKWLDRGLFWFYYVIVDIAGYLAGGIGREIEIIIGLFAFVLSHGPERGTSRDG